MHLVSDERRIIRDYDPEPPSEPGKIWMVELNPETGKQIVWRVAGDPWPTPPSSPPLQPTS